jgi:hypothetical protein
VSGESKIFQFDQDMLGACWITESRLSLWVCRCEFLCKFLVMWFLGRLGRSKNIITEPDGFIVSKSLALSGIGWVWFGRVTF